MPLSTLSAGLATLAGDIQKNDPVRTRAKLLDIEQALEETGTTHCLQAVYSWLSDPKMVGHGSRLSALQAVNSLRQQLAEEEMESTGG